jgi:hypothetical protein
MINPTKRSPLHGQPMTKAWVKIFIHVPVRPMTRRIDGRHFPDPTAAALAVVRRLADDGVGVVGHYDNVSVTLPCENAYRAIPGSAATPTAGVPGELHREEERIIAFSAPKDALAAVVRALKDNHPYETPVIDVFDLVRHELDGLGP